MADDGDRIPSPEETLRLIEEQRAATVSRLRGDPVLLYVPWGTAWLVGFSLLFLHYGLDGRPYAPISLWQALAVHLIAQVVAGAFAAYGITKQTSGVRGDISTKGTMYGYSWFAGMAVMTVIGIRLAPMLPEAEGGLLWAGIALLVVAILYMAGGAIFLNWRMFFLGVAVAAVDAVGVVLGPGWHALLAAVLLGGGQIVLGLWWRRHP
ncbi:hypothetical protein [Nonomuraea rhizosphaerae]|uniref:hypothetical protein n=1 Tax=Nonomuraea rhizosphaerae TaxID=2665663 RepID=UPI001C5E4886|nr:hypothetical protein [Nonomuraea rhizosphaerae]